MSDPTYDRELIACMLDDAAGHIETWAPEAMRAQAALLRAADNADAAGVRTVNATGGVRAQFEAWWAREGNVGKGYVARIATESAWAGWQAALAQQPEACDMGALCIGCEPRNADGTCPGQHPETWRAGFLAGAKWWEWEKTGATMWQSDQQKAYEAALKKRPSPEAPAQEAVGWIIDWPGEPELGHYFSERPSKSGRSRPLYTAQQPAIPEGWVLVQRRDAQCLIDNAPDCSHVLLAARRVRDLLRPTQEPDHG